MEPGLWSLGLWILDCGTWVVEPGVVDLGLFKPWVVEPGLWSLGCRALVVDSRLWSLRLWRLGCGALDCGGFG